MIKIVKKHKASSLSGVSAPMPASLFMSEISLETSQISDLQKLTN